MCTCCCCLPATPVDMRAMICVQPALRAEDLEGDAEAEYGATSGRAFLGSTRSASVMGRTTRSAGMGMGSTSGRPFDTLSISSGGQSPVPQPLPTPSSATTKRGAHETRKAHWQTESNNVCNCPIDGCTLRGGPFKRCHSQSCSPPYAGCSTAMLRSAWLDRQPTETAWHGQRCCTAVKQKK